MEKFKRKWYKRVIDPSFDIEYTAPQTSSQPSQPSAGQAFGQAYFQAPPRPPQNSTLAKVQCLLFLAMFPAVFIGKGIHFAMTAHFAGLIQWHGMPKLSKEYWARCLPDENLHCILFCFLYLFFDQASIWFIPEGIMAAICVANMAIFYPTLPSFVENYASKIRTMEYHLLGMKAQAEIFAGIFAIIMVFIGGISLIFPMLYWQFLRVKYMVNPYTKAAFTQLRISGDDATANWPSFRWAWDKIKGFMEYMGSAHERQSSCSVM